MTNTFVFVSFAYYVCTSSHCILLQQISFFSILSLTTTSTLPAFTTTSFSLNFLISLANTAHPGEISFHSFEGTFGENLFPMTGAFLYVLRIILLKTQ